MMNRYWIGTKCVLATFLAVWVSLGSTGCSKRTLSWTSLSETSGRLGSTKRVAVAASATAGDEEGMFGAHTGEFASIISAELLARGYRITMLRDTGHGRHSARTKEVLTARADTQPVAKIERETTSGGGDMTARQGAAKDVGADLLFEFTIQSSQKMVMHTSVSPIPIVPTKSTMEWKRQIRQITLNVTSVADQVILGTTTVHFSSPTDKIQNAVKDLLLGLDMMRQGKPTSQVELTGPAGVLPK